MALRFYNTLSQQVEEFVPREGNVVRMYTCGPTVYHYVHIGNFRTFTFQDILRRWLKVRGYELRHVMNITDVEDKIIRNAVAQKKELRDYTAEYEEAFLEDARLLRLQQPERMVRATEHVTEMGDAIQQLEGSGYTYRSDGSVYFRIAKFPNYGRLSHIAVDGMRAGARVDVDEYEKDDARDFVLWKAPKEGEPFWESPVGPGRPGWHIECSVMAMKYLGETLDIHAGGVDLTFPHHENEIAQSEALTGKQFVRYWLHSEHLIVEGQKMSKSLNNFYTLRDVLGMGYHPEVVRYLLAAVPYRNKVNFTFDGLKAAATSIERLRNFRLRLGTSQFPEGIQETLESRAKQASSRFDSSLDDDLNTAEALAAVFDYVRDVNTAMDAGGFRAGNLENAKGLLARFDGVFDVLEPTGSAESISDDVVEGLIAERLQARKARNFARSDEIRAALLERGVIIEDTKEGSRWKRRPS